MYTIYGKYINKSNKIIENFLSSSQRLEIALAAGEVHGFQIQVDENKEIISNLKKRIDVLEKDTEKLNNELIELQVIKNDEKLIIQDSKKNEDFVFKNFKDGIFNSRKNILNYEKEYNRKDKVDGQKIENIMDETAANFSKLSILLEDIKNTSSDTNDKFTKYTSICLEIENIKRTIKLNLNQVNILKDKIKVKEEELNEMLVQLNEKKKLSQEVIDRIESENST
tara:strand:+ start:730 stop:1404 length:675 start_codon:yes stop_codon:yes gene_type:complete